MICVMTDGFLHRNANFLAALFVLIRTLKSGAQLGSGLVSCFINSIGCTS
jgi:hypothetical protein